MIEEMDIKDLTEYMSNVINENIIMVFENYGKIPAITQGHLIVSLSDSD